jgi:hypothetical protein
MAPGQSSPVTFSTTGLTDCPYTFTVYPLAAGAVTEGFVNLHFNLADRVILQLP